MKIFKVTRWVFFVLSVLSVVLLFTLMFTENSYKTMRTVGAATEDMICDILFVFAPLAMGLAALSALIVIVKRCYGSKMFMSTMSVMFLVFSLLVLLGRGIRTDRIMRTFESPDGKHSLYYVQEHDDDNYISPDTMRVYRRKDRFTYEALFTVDNDKTDLISWENDGVVFDDQKYEYSSF